ncbi:MAG: NlpC/P60 family protein [Pseudomonadota bacterium]
MIDPLDKRLNAYRSDLADIALQDKVKADRYAAGDVRVVTQPVLDLHVDPDPASEIGTQALLGEIVRVFDEADGMSWIQLDDDRYVGYAKSHALAPEGPKTSHIVRAPRTFIYSDADLRSPVRAACSMGSRILPVETRTTRGTDYFVLSDGSAVIADHVAPLADVAPDYVAVAAQLLLAPYLWGGTSAFGLDCSGLVRLSMAMCGRLVPRDTDMQAAALGEEIDCGDDFTQLRRGDLLFWKGHVAIAEDNRMAIHASGHSMQVVREPVQDAIGRIARFYGKPICARRP